METVRKLTFEGFLKQYVTELSGVQTASIHKLADCLQDNPRLKEPLYVSYKGHHIKFLNHWKCEN